MKNLPVPVFLRPLDEKDASIKVLLVQCLNVFVSCSSSSCPLPSGSVHPVNSGPRLLVSDCVTVLQLWCAAGVNLSGGKTRDGGSIVGASVFYNDVPGPESPTKKMGSQSSLDKLDQDLKVHARPWP